MNRFEEWPEHPVYPDLRFEGYPADDKQVTSTSGVDVGASTGVQVELPEYRAIPLGTKLALEPLGHVTPEATT